MISVWSDLIVNFAVVLLFISVWRNLRHTFGSLNLISRRILFGVLMGVAAIASEMLAVEATQGIFFSLRTALVAIAAGYGGPISGVVAALFAGAFRYAEGGVGLNAGLVSIAASLGLGLLVHVPLLPKLSAQWRPILLANAALIAFYVAAFALPGGWGNEAFRSVVIPVGSTIFVSTLIMSWIVLSGQRSARERDLLRAGTLQSPDYHYIKDANGKFVAVNHATARINGFEDTEDIIGLSDLDLDGSQRGRDLFDAEQAMMREGYSQHALEEMVQRSDGPHWYSSSKVPLRSPDGDIIGLVGVTQDVTERKKLEISLEQTKNRLAFALAEMSDGLAMFDEDQRLLFSNERYLAMFPLTRHVRTPGNRMSDILRHVVKTGEQFISTPEEPELWIDTIVENLSLNTEEQAHMYDGRWLSIRTRSTKNGHAMVLVSDITQSKLAEMDLIRSAERLRTLAETDGLTGLSNRRSFDSALEISMRKAQENRSKLSLLMIDIDHFKSYNDTLGHAEGDECLRQVASLLQSCVTRSVDVVARYGGEEFGLILIGTDIDGAVLVGDRIRETLELVNLTHEASEFGRITVSIGAAPILHGEDTPDSLIKRADAALYTAKRAGRDRTEVWKSDRRSKVTAG